MHELRVRGSRAPGLWVHFSISELPSHQMGKMSRLSRYGSKKPTVWCVREASYFESYQAFFIQQLQNAHFGFNEVNNRLIVIEVYQSPGDVFLHVFFLLKFKDMLEIPKINQNEISSKRVYEGQDQA